MWKYRLGPPFHISPFFLPSSWKTENFITHYLLVFRSAPSSITALSCAATSAASSIFLLVTTSAPRSELDPIRLTPWDGSEMRSWLSAVVAALDARRSAPCRRRAGTGGDRLEAVVTSLSWSILSSSSVIERHIRLQNSSSCLLEEI